MAEIRRLRSDLALERERCAGLVRELTAAPPGSRRTAASRNLAERVAACVRAIEVDDETATCARSLVREARERAKAAEADLARMRAELDATREALRAHLFCDECEELATRCHAESASFGCDAHGVGDGWADATHGNVLVALARPDGTELRVSLHRYEGRPFVRVAPWSRGAAGEAWPVKGKGATLKTRELAAVARALLDALDAANDGQSGGAAP